MSTSDQSNNQWRVFTKEKYHEILSSFNTPESASQNFERFLLKLKNIDLDHLNEKIKFLFDVEIDSMDDVLPIFYKNIDVVKTFYGKQGSYQEQNDLKYLTFLHLLTESDKYASKLFDKIKFI